MTIRERTETTQAKLLHPKAALSCHTKGRLTDEEEGEIRTAFQRDRDRIIHCKSFRRLKHKTQVFLATKGDHYRTRLTHTLEVSQIARTIARALRLNEDLTEAIALGHDLGHTPFGHAGEDVLRELLSGGFNHYEQSLRVVDVLENKGQGLNLTFEVRNGIVKHSKGMGEILTEESENMSFTLEGQIVRVSDVIAYVNHDLDDAIRAGIIHVDNIPADLLDFFGDSHSKRIDTMVKDVVYSTMDGDYSIIRMNQCCKENLYRLRGFLYQNVYDNDLIRREFKKAKKILKELLIYYLEHPDAVSEEINYQQDEKKKQTVCDFIASMTDRFALAMYEKLFLPEPGMVI